LRNPLTAVLAIAVSVIPALFESRDPLGPYRRLLNSVLVVVRLCIILAAVVVSPPRRLIASSPCRLALPPRRIVAVVAVASPPRIRRSLARISPPPWARVGPLRRARPRPRVSAPVAHGAEPGRGSHTTNANHLVFRAGSPATPAVQPPPVGARRWSPSSSCSGWC
jgi:hypothetical protein